MGSVENLLHLDFGIGYTNAYICQNLSDHTLKKRVKKFFLNHLQKIEVQLIYNVVLASGVQRSDSDIYIYIYTHTHTYTHIYTYICIYIFLSRLCSIIGYYKALNIVPCATQ